MDVREQLCYSDAYARTVEARVADVDATGDAPSSSSTGRSSTRVAAASRPTGAAPPDAPTAGRGRFERRRKSGGDIVHELEPAPRRPAGARRRRSPSISTGPGATR